MPKRAHCSALRRGRRRWRPTSMSVSTPRSQPLRAQCTGCPVAVRLASSSAAGGLRMVTVGLVRELTAEAARQAALGAGAKLVGSFAYRLTAADRRTDRRAGAGHPAAVRRHRRRQRRRDPAQRGRTDALCIPLPCRRCRQSRDDRRDRRAAVGVWKAGHPDCERASGTRRAGHRARPGGDPQRVHASGSSRPKASTARAVKSIAC